jgi:hypothetical protein
MQVIILSERLKSLKDIAFLLLLLLSMQVFAFRRRFLPHFLQLTSFIVQNKARIAPCSYLLLCFFAVINKKF